MHTYYNTCIRNVIDFARSISCDVLCICKYIPFNRQYKRDTIENLTQFTYSKMYLEIAFNILTLLFNQLH